MRTGKRNAQYLREWRKKNLFAYRAYQKSYMRRWRMMKKLGLNYLPSESEV